MALKKQIIIYKRKIDLELNLMYYKGKTKKIEPRLIKLLIMLHKANGSVISKKEIMDSVWSDTCVTEDSLTNAISKLRMLFKDEKKTEVIETIWGVGYRLKNPKFFLRFSTNFQKTILILIIISLLYILLGSGLVTWIKNLLV